MTLLIFAICVIASALLKPVRFTAALCAFGLVVLSLVMAWIHTREAERVVRLQHEIDADARGLFLAKACLSLKTDPEKWSELRHLFSEHSTLGNLSPCDDLAGISDGLDNYELDVSNYEFAIRDRIRQIREYNGSVWGRHRQWWFVFWLPGLRLLEWPA